MESCSFSSFSFHTHLDPSLHLYQADMIPCVFVMGHPIFDSSKLIDGNAPRFFEARVVTAELSSHLRTHKGCNDPQRRPQQAITDVFIMNSTSWESRVASKW